MNATPPPSSAALTTCSPSQPSAFAAKPCPPSRLWLRVELETRTAEDEAGTRIEIAGGNILSVEEAGLPIGTSLVIKDLFFNTPARRKFLKQESTELSHIAALVTHYALAHSSRHFELHSQTQALLIAPAVNSSAERLFQIFGREVAALMIPTAAEVAFTHAGLPELPPWKRESDYAPPDPGMLRVTGFVSKPELQKLNRNSIYVFVNHRLIRDRLVLHALTEAYRNIIPPTSFPVVLLFLEMPPQEVDVNVHPAKTEVRFRQPAFVHDFIRDTIRTTLMQARPAASFAQALNGVPFSDASSSLLLGVSPLPGAPSDPFFDPRREPTAFGDSEPEPTHADAEPFTLAPTPVPESPGRLAFSDSIAVGYEPAPEPTHYGKERVIENPSLYSLSTLKPLGQIRDSFILAVNDEGLWIVDQHVAHERVLFEKDPPRAQDRAGPAPTPPDASAHRPPPRPDGRLRPHRGRTRTQRL